MDADLYPVLHSATEEELKLLHRYVNVLRSGVACEAGALSQAIVEMACKGYESCLGDVVQHLDGGASPHAAVPVMEARVLVLLFNQALPNVVGADLVRLKRGMHRFGLRKQDWRILMAGEAVDAARLQQLLVSENPLSYLLMAEVVRIIFAHLLAEKEPQAEDSIVSFILFGTVFGLVFAALKALFGASCGILIPIVAQVALMRKRQSCAC